VRISIDLNYIKDLCDVIGFSDDVVTLDVVDVRDVIGVRDVIVVRDVSSSASP
jgi:hypothetical protein